MSRQWGKALRHNQVMRTRQRRSVVTVWRCIASRRSRPCMHDKPRKAGHSRQRYSMVIEKSLSQQTSYNGKKKRPPLGLGRHTVNFLCPLVHHFSSYQLRFSFPHLNHSYPLVDSPPGCPPYLPCCFLF